MDDRSTAAATPRRDFLRVMALAPAAVAGCAGARATPAEREGPGAPVAPGVDDPLEPLRAYPLAQDAEPAFVFRAAPARPGA